MTPPPTTGSLSPISVGSLVRGSAFAAGILIFALAIPRDSFPFGDVYWVLRPMTAAGCAMASAAALTRWPPLSQTVGPALRRLAWVAVGAVALALALFPHPRGALFAWVPIWLLDWPGRRGPLAFLVWVALGIGLAGTVWLGYLVVYLRMDPPVLGPNSLAPPY